MNVIVMDNNNEQRAILGSGCIFWLLKRLRIYGKG